MQGLVGNSWIGLDQRDEDRPKLSILACELDREGGEYRVEVTPIQEVSRLEERGAELSACECPLCDRLRDGTLPRPSQSVQPIDRWPIEIPRPELDRVQDMSADSLEAAFAAAVPIPGCPRAGEVVEDGYISCERVC